MKKLSQLPVLSEDDLSISRAWARDSMWAAIADLFEIHRERDGLTYAVLAQRINKSRSQVQRWLATPSNMSFMSAGLLAEGLDADIKVELTPRYDPEHGDNEISRADEARELILSSTPQPESDVSPLPESFQETTNPNRHLMMAS